MRGASSLAGLLLPAILAACGGGGGPEAPASVPVALGDHAVTDKRTLLYGYYGTCPTCQAEVRDHVNFVHVLTTDNLTETVRQLTEARQSGLANVVLGVQQVYYSADPEATARALFTTLSGANVLDHIVALYPRDEPDLAGDSDEKVTAMNLTLRRVMAEFPALRDTRLAVIYSGRQTWPGLATYDWVGFDDYNAREGIFVDGLYTDLKLRLRPDQGIILVPGGADPWRQDPQPFLDAARSDPQVVAIMPFIWFDYAAPDVGKGIRSNGMRGAYCQAGKSITGMAGAC